MRSEPAGRGGGRRAGGTAVARALGEVRGFFFPDWRFSAFPGFPGSFYLPRFLSSAVNVKFIGVVPTLPRNKGETFHQINRVKGLKPQGGTNGSG